MHDFIQNSLGPFPLLTVNKIDGSTHEHAGIKFSIVQSHHAIWNPNLLCQEMLSTMYTQCTYLGDANDMSAALRMFSRKLQMLSLSGL